MVNDFSKNPFVRVRKEYDEQHRLIGYDIIEASKDPLFTHKLDIEIEKNKEIIKREQLEYEEKQKIIFDEKSFLKHYSLTKLINAFNFSLIKGLIGVDKKAEIVNEVCNIALIEDAMERAKRIELLMTKDIEELGYFKSIFENMED